MKLKRILAALLACITVSTSVAAFTPFYPDETASETENTEETEKEQQDTQDDGFIESMVGKYAPDNYQYQMFLQVLEAYVDNHLYEFTEEDVLYKFFYDFLGDNPMYLQYFLDYLLGTMDPYSSYQEADSGFLDPGSGYTGFGFTVEDSDEGVFISSVLKGSNAEAAGFMAGDRFVSISGINVGKHSFDIVSAVLANPLFFSEQTEQETPAQDGTNTENAATEQKAPEFEIVVDRNGEKVTISLSKGPMTVTQISSSVDENNGKPTAYIQLSSFLGDDTQEEFISRVKKYASEGIKHLTIDLRGNGGGSLEMALAMAETFLEMDELICYYNDRTLEEPSPVYSTTDKVSFDSITILVDEYTASAAELFTSILKDKKLATVIGTKTFGKSLGQTVFSLANGDYITITTYQMLNESLESYDGIGIIPDLVIEDVEMCYVLPALGVFNHTNAKTIKEGEYSEVTKALEDRMVIMGLLREEFADGVFDSMTKQALYIFQKDSGIEATGYVNDATVSKITKLINSYKQTSYYDNTQYEVAMIVHHSFSQGKRLIAEKERLREKQAEMFVKRDEALEKEFEAA